jgi:thioredoxin 1
MRPLHKVVIVAALLFAVAIVLAVKWNRGRTNGPSAQSDPIVSASLPRLVDLGAATCIPCKMMAPVLENLRTEYAGKLTVEVIDTREHPDAAEAYHVRVIPTQIFFDSARKEVFRHEGFMAKDDIVMKWKELGVDLDAR